MENYIHIASLIIKRIKSELIHTESAELDQWLSESEANQTLFNKIIDNRHLQAKEEIYHLFDKERVWSNIESQIDTAPRFLYMKLNQLKYAAAILLPLIMIGAYLIIQQSNSIDNDSTFAESVIIPGNDKAILKLANGEEIVLSDSKTISINLNNGSQVQNSDNALVYTIDSETNTYSKPEYNELVVPVGGKYKVQLADGSIVQLNAGSSLRFPVSFTDSVRQVFLVGEAYFDVTHTGKAFIVSNDNMDIRVLGTSFNVRAYKEDKIIHTTLVEGKVAVQNNNDSTSELLYLSPSEQFQFNKNTSQSTVSQVDTEIYTAWVNGKFYFQNESLDNIMIELARWYDFEYQFVNESLKEYHYTGRISRTENIENLLYMIEQTASVKFEREGKEIRIK